MLSVLEAGLVAALAPAPSVAGPALGLGLLGLGWNLGLVGETAMGHRRRAAGEPGPRQGRVDLAVSLSGATAGLSSGG